MKRYIKPIAKIEEAELQEMMQGASEVQADSNAVFEDGLARENNGFGESGSLPEFNLWED